MKISTSIVILLALALGFIFPVVAILKDLTLPLFFILMYFSALDLDINKKNFLRKEIVFWLIISIIFLPILSYFLGLSLNQYLLLGVVIAILSPNAMNAPIFTGLIDGDKELSVSITLFSSLLSIVYMPLMLLLIFGLNFAIPYQDILTKIFIMIFLPLIFAILTRKFLKKDYVKIIKHSKSLVPLILFLFLWIIISTYSNQIWSNLDEIATVFPITFIISALGFLIGYLVMKDKKIKRTFSMSCGYRNLSFVLAIVYNLNPLTSIPSVFYIISQHLLISLITWLYDKKRI